MEIKVSRTKVVEETLKAIQQGSRFIVHQGSSRSGKTYGIMQTLNALSFLHGQNGCGLIQDAPLSISVCSITMPHLRKGAMRDWQKIMFDSGAYSEKFHNKSSHTYNYPLGGYLEFFSAEEPTKVRGPGRDILFLNEANLFPFNTFQQLNIRTKKVIIMDFNPADEYHWIYDRILTRNDCCLIKTTYKDNPFLPPEQVSEIEKMQEIGGNLWRVYGLGERGVSEGLIYPNHSIYTGEWPNKCTGYGLDFGFSNDPTALIQCFLSGNELYVKEVVFETGMTNADLIRKIKDLNIRKRIFADSAEPQRIEELRRAGISASPAKKGAGSVKYGIDKMQRVKIFVHPDSSNIIKELKTYKWDVDRNNEQLKNPIPKNDHAMDAIRYFLTMQRKVNTK